MHSPVRNLAVILSSGFLALIPPSVFGQSGNFVISQHGKPVGSASYSFSSGSQGNDSTSVVRVEMQGLNYSLSKTETLSEANHLRRAQLSATVNGSAVTVVAAPDGAQMVINISANGHSSATRLTPHSYAVFLPDFDPGALQTLLILAAANNNRDLWAIIPKGAGTVSPIQLSTYADELGTLDGKPVAVHHLVATMGSAVTDIFSGPENQLLQAELPQEGFAMVRKDFVLTPPAKPGAPPSQ